MLMSGSCLEEEQRGIDRCLQRSEHAVLLRNYHFVVSFAAVRKQKKE